MAYDDMFGEVPAFDEDLKNNNNKFSPSLNRVYLVGNLVDNPEIAYTKTNKAVTSFTIYVKRPFNDRETGKKESDFIDIKVWGDQAENCAKYLEKGKKVAVVGELRISQYTDRNDIVRNDIKVNADNVTFM